MRIILLLFFSICLISPLRAQQNGQVQVSGQVLDSDGKSPLPGVNVIVKGTTVGTVTDSEGTFSLLLSEGDYWLVFSFIGYSSQEIRVLLPQKDPLKIQMGLDELSLSTVEVLSTGFQELSAERSTGSFAHLTNELVSRRVSTNLIDRMEDLTPGLIFNRDRPDLEKGENISIRGNSSLLTNSQPLIVVDNLAYDGPLESINPNDVESITVLKDAAAASIWGARAGNGVIVITTKSGKKTSPMKVNLVSNLTVGKPFDPFYNPQISVPDFIEVERRLFAQGYFDGQYNAFDKGSLSPVVESLFQVRNGEITQEELEQRIAGYKQEDLRRDLANELYRATVNQQYALNLSGGSDFYTYFMGVGVDQNQQTEISDSRKRITLNLRQSWSSKSNRFNLGLVTYLANSSNSSGFPSIDGLSPYERLRDSEGNPRPVIRNYNVRFLQSLRDTDLLNWDYIPLNEINASKSRSESTEFRFSPSFSWRLAEGLVFKTDYQYWRSLGSGERINRSDSYFSRNLINLFSILSQTGEVDRKIPLGGINDKDYSQSWSHTLRSQINWTKQWSADHELLALAGFEVKDSQRTFSRERSYGVDPITGLSLPVDYISFFPQLHTGFTSRIPFVQNAGGFADRFVSGFANAGYTYKRKYLATASARRDASNLYGVSTNNRAVPLWSAGLGWILSEEAWMDKDWISYLKLKMSYGFNGNTNPRATAFTTAQYFGASSNSQVGTPWLSIIRPPNPQLRWERIKIINLGSEFELWNQGLSGSLEVFQKQGIDLFGVLPTYPSSGQTTLTKNYAETKTNGLDLVVNGRLITGKINWSASLLYSHVNEKVTDYRQNPTSTQLAGYSSGLSGIIPVPVQGYPLFSIFSFPFAGLDPDNGDPMGLLNGEPSTSYAEIFSTTGIEDLIFEGAATPTHFGAIRNSISWKGLDISTNISYRMGYYFKKESVEYDFLNRAELVHSDYALRWQKPGDELVTDVPSDPEMLNPNRTAFDRMSGRRVRKGDHFRWQDVRIAYTWTKAQSPRLPVSQIQVYTYMDNLGVIWKAAKDVRDPDFRNFQAPRSYSFGLAVTF